MRFLDAIFLGKKGAMQLPSLILSVRYKNYYQHYLFAFEIEVSLSEYKYLLGHHPNTIGTFEWNSLHEASSEGHSDILKVKLTSVDASITNTHYEELAIYLNYDII